MMSVGRRDSEDGGNTDWERWWRRLAPPSAAMMCFAREKMAW